MKRKRVVFTTNYNMRYNLRHHEWKECFNPLFGYDHFLTDDKIKHTPLVKRASAVHFKLYITLSSSQPTLTNANMEDLVYRDPCAFPRVR